jgi:hypothetical protein
MKHASLGMIRIHQFSPVYSLDLKFDANLNKKEPDTFSSAKRWGIPFSLLKKSTGAGFLSETAPVVKALNVE